MDNKESSSLPFPQSEKERLKCTVARVDHYYGSVNNKSAVYIAINTFITGGILILITRTEALNELWQLAYFFLGGCMFLGIASLIIVSYNNIPFFFHQAKFPILFWKHWRENLSGVLYSFKRIFHRR